MSTSPSPGRAHAPDIGRLLRAGLIVAVVDGVWASAAALLYGRTITRLWQGVASVPFGPHMLDLGMRSVLIGLALHVLTAFAWSAVLLLLLTRWPWLRAVLASRFGAVKVGAVYGPMIWLVMSGVVIPGLTGRALSITPRWWVELAAHVFTVGIPMAWALSTRGATDAPELPVKEAWDTT